MIDMFLNLCENAYWRGHFERERRKLQKPGEFIQNLSPEVREKLKELKSDDMKHVRWDAISWMCHLFYQIGS